MGQQAHTDDVAHGAGATTYDRANHVIANNAHGGAGYFAEAHHTASLNIDANRQHIDVSADRLGSTAFGSPDIVLSDGSMFNPKFYATAEQSYRAGAELVDNGEQLAAKYVDQTILVPSDQLEHAAALHSQAIDHAMEAGDLSRVQALQSIRFDDHIHQAGVESTPLTYADAHAGAAGIREGVLPEYVGQEMDLVDTVGQGALLAASLAMAASIGPQLVGNAANVFRGKLSLDEAIARLHNSMGDARTRSQLGWAAARGSGAAAVTALDAMDPTGAALLVSVLVDVLQLSQRLKKGEITAEDFPKLVWAATKDRTAYTALAAGSFWVLGPIGLLTPIIVRRMVSDAALQRQTLDAWNGAAQAMHAELGARIKQASLLGDIRSRYRQTDDVAELNHRLLDAASADLERAGRLLGFTAQPGPTSASGAPA